MLLSAHASCGTRRRHTAVAITASAAAVLLVGCLKPAELPNADSTQSDPTAVVVADTSRAADPVRYATTFRLEPAAGYTVLRLITPEPKSGFGDAIAREVVVVLHPRGTPPSDLPASLADALTIAVPATRFAVNAYDAEAFLSAIGAREALVAVGGTNSYDDSVRARAVRGELGQLGVGFHQPPNLDVALAARPDVFFIRMSDLKHGASLTRARALGLAALPYFAESEATYLGRAEWIKVFGALTGRTAVADSIFRSIEARVDSLKTLAHTRPARTVFWAYFEGADRWVATVRGPVAQFLRDANGINIFEKPEDNSKEETEKIGTEVMLTRARDAECWVAGDGWPEPVPVAVAEQFAAFHRRCMALYNGRYNAAADAWDWFQSGFVRPDLILREVVKVLHPDLVPQPWDYLRPYVPPRTAAAR
jgi:ABC-type Fe3+-hydroxamate transport system substrate-binding protein